MVVVMMMIEGGGRIRYYSPHFIGETTQVQRKYLKV